MSLWVRLKTLLESRRSGLVAVVLGVLLTAPTLFTGLHTEDFVHRMRVRESAADFPLRLNLYGREAATTPANLEQRNLENQIAGFLPWTAYPRFDVSFWRPLSSLTHHVDYRVFDRWPWLMHAQNVAWYALLVGAAAALYRRTLSTPFVAGLSAVLYAVDDAHGHAIGWLANRNGVMAAFFGVLAILLFDRARRDGSRSAALLVPPVFAAALLSAEFGLSAAGYLAAHGLFVDTAPPRRRVLAALPWVLTAATWFIVYRALGHSAYGSGLYINPTSEPAAFFSEMTERWVVLFAAQFGAPPADLWTRLDRADQGLVVFAATAVFVLVCRGFIPILKRDRTARFYAAGTVLSLPPACATFPEDRLLFFAGLGAMPLVATFLTHAFDQARRAELWRMPRLAALAGAAFVVLHAGVAPAALPYRSLHMHRYEAEMREASRQIFSHVRDPKDAIVVVNGPDSYFLSMLGPTTLGRGDSIAHMFLSLAGTLDEVAVTRSGPKAVTVRPRDGFLSRVFNVIYRGRAHPLRRGQKIALLGIDVFVTEVDQWGEPLEARFEFAVPLDHPNLKWLAFEAGHVRPFRVPALGETVVVRGR